MAHRRFPFPRRALLGFAALLPAALGCLVAGMDNPSKNIFYSAGKGDLAAVKALVEQAPTVVRQTQKGRDLTPLHFAADGGHVEVIDYLVAQGAEVDARDNYGQTPLHHAADADQPQAVERLVALGAEIDARDRSRNTPLHCAANTLTSIDAQWHPPQLGEKDRLEVVESLIAQGAEIEARNKLGQTPLHNAAENDQAAVIEYLVSQGARDDTRSGEGRTPLHEAAYFGAPAAVKTLVRLGADPAARVRTPEMQEIFGPSVLSLTASQGHFEIVKFLLKQDLPVRYGEGNDEETALHWAAQGPSNPAVQKNPARVAEYKAIIDLLAQRLGGIDIVLPMKFNQRTPLLIAAFHRQPAIVKHLLETYPDIDLEAKGTDGKTAMQLAMPDGSVGDEHAQQRAEKDAAEVIRLLSEAHAAKARAKDAAKNVKEADVE